MSAEDDKGHAAAAGAEPPRFYKYTTDFINNVPVVHNMSVILRLNNKYYSGILWM